MKKLTGSALLVLCLLCSSCSTLTVLDQNGKRQMVTPSDFEHPTSAKVGGIVGGVLGLAGGATLSVITVSPIFLFTVPGLGIVAGEKVCGGKIKNREKRTEEKQ